MQPLKTLVRTYLNTPKYSGFEKYYQSTYVPPSSMNNEQLANAYFPGPRQGVNNGIWSNPFSGDPSLPMKRNYYSTKLVPIKKLTGEEDSYWAKPLLIERNNISEGMSDTETTGGETKNTLNATLLEDFKDALTH